MDTFLSVLLILGVYFLIGHISELYYNSLPWKERRKINHILSDAKKKRELKRLHKRLKGKWYQRWFDPSDPGGGPAGPLIRR